MTKAEKKKFSKIKAFLLDMDGTLYIGGKMLPGADKAVESIRVRGGRICFLTNNSSRSQRDYALKLNGLGIMASRDEVLTSQAATMAYLKKNYPGKSLFVLGTPSLKEEFVQNGFFVAGGNADIAILGYDTTLDYATLAEFCLKIREGAPYIATHADLNCPSPRGMLPDAGSMIELISASAARRPDIICGKPFRPMTDAIFSKFSLPPLRGNQACLAQSIAMIGDRMTTDMAFAKANGFLSVLVLTGETTREMLDEGITSGRFAPPDIVLESIGELC